MTHLELPPGRYHIRVGVAERGAGQVGSIFHDLEVPSFAAEALALSGLLISSAREARVPVAVAQEERQGALPPASTRRRFSGDDELLVMAEVYAGSREAIGAVEVSTVLEGADGTIVFQSTDKLDAEELSASGRRATHQVRIRLTGLAAGEYRLQVKARDLRDGRETERSSAIEVTASES
jgi:hypothetical protein